MPPPPPRADQQDVGTAQGRYAATGGGGGGDLVGRNFGVGSLVFQFGRQISHTNSGGPPASSSYPLLRCITVITDNCPTLSDEKVPFPVVCGQAP